MSTKADKSPVFLMRPEALAQDGRGGAVDHGVAVKAQRECPETRGAARYVEIVVEDVFTDANGIQTVSKRLVKGGLANPRMTGDHDFEPSPETKRHVRAYMHQTRVERRIRAMQEWRKDSGNRGLSRSANDEVLERIAKANPMTMEDLRSIEGVNEFLLEVASFELLELLRKT